MKQLEGTICWGDFTLTYSGISDKGLVRKENEDDFLVMPEHFLFCVADGMGGEQAGKTASQTTLESVVKSMTYLSNPEDATMPYGMSNDLLNKPLLTNITHFSNTQVNKKSDGRTMGSTLVMAHFNKKGLDIAHVGDSRLYLWRNNQLAQLTEDHSLVYELFKSGNITQQEMATHQMRNVITRAIGTNSTVEPSLAHIEINAGDLYLLCSDGLTNMLDAAEMIKILKNSSNLTNTAKTFISQANKAGGRDNITVVLISIGEAG